MQSIPLSELHSFPNHPFKIQNDEAMQDSADSIKKYGVLIPAIARPLEDGGYAAAIGRTALDDFLASRLAGNSMQKKQPA